MTSKRREALLQIDRAILRLRSTQTNRSVRVLMERRFGRNFNRSHSLIVDAVGESSMDAGGQISIASPESQGRTRRPSTLYRRMSYPDAPF
jgi:hypothetical protein